MGQVYAPSSGGIVVNTIDRESGPGAGAGATGNRAIFLGASAGLNSTASDFIAIGNLAGSAGLLSASGMNGTTIVGSRSILGTLTAGASSGVVALGSNILPLAQAGFGDSVYVGNNILTGFLKTNSATAAYRNVVIGNNAGLGTNFGLNSAFDQNVVIGYGAAKITAGGSQPYVSNTIIGNAAAGTNNADSVSSCVIIGSGAGPGAATTGTISSCIFIGNGAAPSGSTANPSGHIVIGTNATCSAANSSIIVIGNTSTINSGNSFGIIIGTSAGNTVAFPAANEVVFIGGSSNMMLYGVMSSGNLILGNITVSANRRWRGTPGTNNVLIPDGTAGSVAEVATGGYFYVTNGVLNWRDKNGIETQLSMNAAGQLANTILGAGYTNNAGVAGGTLLNAPSAGNPTKWIPINDNGTIRNIPAW